MKNAKKHIRLATRDSKLAVWQAQHVQKKLKQAGVTSELVLVKSKGDLSQEQAVSKLNIVGIFTKAIDEEVLRGRADAGVHSLKDLPTELDKELLFGCVLKREDPRDVLVFKDKNIFKQTERPFVIATGSARRKAQWLNKYPHHKIVGVRGNVDTRLQKLHDNNWDGIILAAAGLKRLQLKTQSKKLNWMVHAPGQGAIAIVGRKADKQTSEILATLNHSETFYSILAERSFLKKIKAGCSSAVGAHAEILHNALHLRAEVLSADGKEKVFIELSGKLEQATKLGEQLAKTAIKLGAKKLLSH